MVDWVQREPQAALAVAVASQAGLLSLMATLLFRVSALSRRQRRLLRGVEGGSLEQRLIDQADHVRAMTAVAEEARRLGLANAEALRGCVQRVGVVRYDAFAMVGGEQSFSLALLDGDDNGMVLTGLYGRSDVRVYAKPITNGGSALALSDEERAAITQGRNGAGATGAFRRGS